MDNENQKSFKYLGHTFTAIRNIGEDEDIKENAGYTAENLDTFTIKLEKWNIDQFYKVAEKHDASVDIYIMDNTYNKVIPCTDCLLLYNC
jgi:hypothetical protein